MSFINIMRIFTSFCTALFSNSIFSWAFPAADNVARLARSGGLDVPEVLTYEDVLRHIQRHKEKRLLVDPLATPVDGMIRSLRRVQL